MRKIVLELDYDEMQLLHQIIKDAVAYEPHPKDKTAIISRLVISEFYYHNSGKFTFAARENKLGLMASDLAVILHYMQCSEEIWAEGLSFTIIEQCRAKTRRSGDVPFFRMFCSAAGI